MSDQTITEPTVAIADGFRRPRPRARRNKLWLSLLAATGVVLVSSIAAYPFLPRTYLALADMQIRPTRREGATTWDQSIAEALDDNAIQTKVDILRSQPMQERVIAKHNLLADPEFNPSLRPSWWREIRNLPWLAPWLPQNRSDEMLVKNKLVQRLTIKRDRKSYLLQVGYELRDPAKAALLANALVDAFLAEQIGRRRYSLEQTLTTLHNTVLSLEKQYHHDEAIERDYLQSSGLIHMDDKESMQRQISTLSTALAEARRHSADTANHAALLAQMQKDGRLDSTSETFNSPVFQHMRELLTQLSTGTHTTNTIIGVAGANPGTVAALRSAIVAEEQRMVGAAQNEAAIGLRNEIDLRLEISRLDARLVEWRTKEWHLNELHRIVLTDLDAIAAARQRYNTEAGRGDVLQPDVEVVAQAALPDRPYFPQPLLYIGGTLALIVLVDGLLLLPSILRANRAA
jgi:uncharacterized protein involved in exopolysaccharide biosynthesis